MNYETCSVYWSQKVHEVSSFNYEIGLIERVFPTIGQTLNNTQQELLQIIDEGQNLTIPSIDDEQYYCPFSDDLSEKFERKFLQFQDSVYLEKDKISNLYTQTLFELTQLDKKSKTVELTEIEKARIKELFDNLETYS